MIQLALWLSIIFIFIFVTSYVYVNEKEKSDSLKLSEETQILKEFQEKEKSRLLQNKNIKIGNNN